MKYFSLNEVKRAYTRVSTATKDKFWGILGILYSIDNMVEPCKTYNINTPKLSTFLEGTFRLKDKKTYDGGSDYSVVFANNWEDTTATYFLIGKPDIMPVIIWAYRNTGFIKELDAGELFEKFVNDFHISRENIEKLFTLKFDVGSIEYSDVAYDDEDLLKELGGTSDNGAVTLKMNKQFVVANAGDLSRGPFFQPLYASLNTLECLIIFPFNTGDYYDIFKSAKSNSVCGTEVRQMIYYGSPGSGKSRKVKDNIQDVASEFKFRTTFHPDTDYASFVGCYKPSMKDGNIEYNYSAQVFTNAYVQAWKNPDKDVYLIIEEINRGNCAQIFGDLFQLLDRDKATGISEYPIKADKDLADYLKDVLGADHGGIKDGELRLPSNLIIYATMNTSDQSLFPMDSAFKRRWDWEYVPIEYGADKESYTYIITIGDKKYRWVDFLKVVNEKIYNTTRSEDKQMGNFFIKKSVDAQEFINKVMFYLWNEVCKEESGTSRNFFRVAVEGNKEGKEFKFVDLFDKAKTNDLLIGFINHLEIGEYTE